MAFPLARGGAASRPRAPRADRRHAARRILVVAIVCGAHATSAQAAVAVDLQARVAAVVSTYVRELAVHPATASSRAAADATDARIARAARGASGKCRDTVGRTRRAVRDLTLSAAVKRARVLDAAVHIYVDC